MQEVDDGAMDLEMQLLSPPTADNDGFRTATNMMHTAILALQSAHMFLAAANHESPPVSSSKTTTYETNLEVAEACDSSSDQHPLTINHPIIINQLQNSQTKNISNIVRHKDLQTLQDFGGLTGVADALRTDLVNGISENEALCRTQTHAFYPTLDRQTFLQFVWNERKNKTILLLSLAAVLSLVFGIYEEGLPDGLHDGLVVFVAIILLVFIASIRK